MDKCNFLRQKKQVQINGEWVDTRSYRYLPYCDGGTPCVIVKNSEPNGKVVIGVNKYDDISSTEKSLLLDADGNGYIEFESDDSIFYVKSSSKSSSSTVEIRGCYVNSFGNYGNYERYDFNTMIISCSTYNRPHRFDAKYRGFHGENLIFRGFDTSKVTDMSNMFYDCMKLKSLDVSNFDTSNVTNMNNMFWGDSSLTSLDVSNFNTSNVTDMGYMFNGCHIYGSDSLDLSNFNTSNVTNMAGMFGYCEITSLDLSGWDTSNVTNMGSMFGH